MNDKIIQDMWTNPKYRKDIFAQPKSFLKKQLKIKLDGVKVVVKVNTKKIFYFIMPIIESNNLSSLELENLQAAVKASSLGSVGSVGSVSSASTSACPVSTAGSVGSVGSLGTAGSALV